MSDSSLSPLQKHGHQLREIVAPVLGAASLAAIQKETVGKVRAAVGLAQAADGVYDIVRGIGGQEDKFTAGGYLGSAAQTIGGLCLVPRFNDSEKLYIGGLLITAGGAMKYVDRHLPFDKKPLSNAALQGAIASTTATAAVMVVNRITSDTFRISELTKLKGINGRGLVAAAVVGAAISTVATSIIGDGPKMWQQEFSK